MKSASQPSKAPWPVWTAILLGAAFLGGLLAVFQWMELFVAASGRGLLCSLSERVDCAPVWGSPFAKAIASTTGLPVAAWGLVWNVAAFSAGLRLGVAMLRRGIHDVHVELATVRWMGIAGGIASIVLGVVSIGIVGVACVTCLFTYALAVVFLIAAFRIPGAFAAKKGAHARALAVAFALAAVAYLALLVPGKRTPVVTPSNFKDAMAKSGASLPDATSVDRARADALVSFLAELPQQARQVVRDLISQYAQSPVHELSKISRTTKPRAPVEIVVWTDLLCGHCKELQERLHEIERAVGPGAFVVKPHQFPLDGQCNPVVSHKMTDDTRCFGARALICLEQGERFFETESALFRAQSELSVEKIVAIVAPVVGGEAALRACVASSETEKKLKDDIAVAESVGIEGTPHVLLNGRTANGHPAFLFAMILAQGRPDHPAFAELFAKASTTP